MAESLHILLGTSVCLSGYVTQVSEPWPVGLLFFNVENCCHNCYTKYSEPPPLHFSHSLSVNKSSHFNILLEYTMILPGSF